MCWLHDGQQNGNDLLDCGRVGVSFVGSTMTCIPSLKLSISYLKYKHYLHMQLEYTPIILLMYTD